MNLVTYVIIGIVWSWLLGGLVLAGMELLLNMISGPKRPERPMPYQQQTAPERRLSQPTLTRLRSEQLHYVGGRSA
jgi:hypothetical protein